MFGDLVQIKSNKPQPSAVDTERVLAAFEDYKSALNQTDLSSPIKMMQKLNKRGQQMRVNERKRVQVELVSHLIEDGLGELEVMNLLASYLIPAAIEVPKTLVVNSRLNSGEHYVRTGRQGRLQYQAWDTTTS
jgi:hypothetical protein